MDANIETGASKNSIIFLLKCYQCLLPSLTPVKQNTGESAVRRQYSKK